MSSALQMEWLCSKDTRKPNILKFNNFLYRSYGSKRKDSLTYLRCFVKDCPSRLILKTDEHYTVTIRVHHNHLYDLQLIRELKFRRALKTVAARRPQVPFPQLYREVSEYFPNTNLCKEVAYQLMQRARKEGVLPGDSTTIEADFSGDPMEWLCSPKSLVPNLLKYNGYLYRKYGDRDRANSYLKCYRTLCPARLILKLNRSELNNVTDVEQATLHKTHNHSYELNFIRELKFRRELKYCAVQQQGPLREIVDDVLAKFPGMEMARESAIQIMERARKYESVSKAKNVRSDTDNASNSSETDTEEVDVKPDINRMNCKRINLHFGDHALQGLCELGAEESVFAEGHVANDDSIVPLYSSSTNENTDVCMDENEECIYETDCSPDQTLSSSQQYVNIDHNYFSLHTIPYRTSPLTL